MNAMKEGAQLGVALAMAGLVAGALGVALTWSPLCRSLRSSAMSRPPS